LIRIRLVTWQTLIRIRLISRKAVIGIRRLAAAATGRTRPCPRGRIAGVNGALATDGHDISKKWLHAGYPLVFKVKFQKFGAIFLKI
jgi:hypothetical protein